jgi:hypothetical protein
MTKKTPAERWVRRALFNLYPRTQQAALKVARAMYEGGPLPSEEELSITFLNAEASYSVSFHSPILIHGNATAVYIFTKRPCADCWAFAVFKGGKVEMSHYRKGKCPYLNYDPL